MASSISASFASSSCLQLRILNVSVLRGNDPSLFTKSCWSGIVNRQIKPDVIEVFSANERLSNLKCKNSQNLWNFQVRIIKVSHLSYLKMLKCQQLLICWHFNIYELLAF